MSASTADVRRIKEARLANIRQELLAPVTAIVGYGEMLHEEAVDGGLEDMVPDLDHVLSAARDLHAMVDKLLAGGAAQHFFDGKDVDAAQKQLRHDLRTPINAIKGYAEMLLEDLEDLGGEALRPDFDKLLSQVNNLLSQLTRIVDFGRADGATDPLEAESTIDSSMVSELVQSIRPVDPGSLLPEETGYILVVDDLETNRELLARRLARDGHRVATAESGRKALEMLAAEEFDLVLLDLMMPEMNGFEVLAHMKDDPNLMTLPVIMVSAFDETDSVIRCIEAGADDYLPKPFNPTLLRARIKSGLEKKQWQDRERQQKQFIRQAFSRYISPAVVDQLVADPGLLSLRGERLEITCVFTDLAGFTTLMEDSNPAHVLPLLNDYLDGMCKIVRDHEGTIDKIVGDALHVFFGAPLAQPDHAERAVTAAMAMDAYAREFMASDAARAVSFGGTRIGVHTGLAVVGNFGGESFFDYTAHGDTVNTAARMESVNSHLGTSICVSSTTAQRCQDVKFRPIGSLVLKGKTQPVEAFEPMVIEESDTVSRSAYLDAYEQMRSGESNALSAFDDLARRYPEDALAHFHAKRLAVGATGTEIILTEK
ncbi:MAG: response regulator [Acidiferrobacterales bacterium]